MARVFVTGGAGYVGSHACKALARSGHEPIVFDNLSTGWREAVKFGPLVEGDLLDECALERALVTHKPDAILHFAGLSNVGESQLLPQLYWRNNVGGSANLLNAAAKANIGAVVFSSTCATYGESLDGTLTEADVQRPINVYGRTKLAVEWMLQDFERAFGIKSMTLRYFNAAGADEDRELGEDHRPETHLIPLVLDTASGKRASITVFGSDYPTADGTCIRDYVHVSDLARAHVLGLDWLLRGGESQALNLGSGMGHSVREVIETAARLTGCDVPVVLGPRRIGDPPKLISRSKLAEHTLGWRAQRSTLTQIIDDAWGWHQRGKYAS